MFSKLFHSINYFLDKMKKDAVSAFSAQTAFFIILSFIPFIMLLLTMIQFLPITEASLVQAAEEFLPHTVNTYVVSLIDEIFHQPSIPTISITALLALWSASKGFLAMIQGFNFIYDIPETRSYIKLRIIASFYTLVFAATLLFTLTILVYGNKIFNEIIHKVPFLEDIALMIISFRTFACLGILFFVFAVMYLLIPNFKNRFFFVIPGAAIASIGWMLFSFLYSFYVDHFANFNTYGNLAVVIITMLWLYFCMYILFIGCEVNEILYHYLVKVKSSKPKKN